MENIYKYTNIYIYITNKVNNYAISAKQYNQVEKII